MFTTIRKHQTWLWAFIIAAVIVSFVIYFTPGGQQGDGGGGRSTFGTIHGLPISRKQYLEAYTEAKLAFLMRYGSWPDQSEARRAGFNLEREIRDRLVLLDQVKKAGIRVSESATAGWIVDNFGGAEQPGSAKERYESFVRNLQRQYNVNEGEFQRFIAHQIGILHLVAVAGVSGKLVTPRAAADAYRQEQEKIEADAAVFSASNYLASVKMDPAAVAQFYTNRESVYRIPDRVQVYYVKFGLSNFLAQADQLLAKNTNLSAEIERAYLASNPSTFTDTNGQVLPPEAAKLKIRQQAGEQQALVEAHKAAAKFATTLEGVRPVSSTNMVKLAIDQALACTNTEPFSEMEGPRGLRVRANFVETAFRLTPQDPIALTPIRAEDGVYLISLKQRFPSQIPALDGIRARVESDFRQAQAVRLAQEAGTNFFQLLTNRLAQGQTFAAVCADAKTSPVALPKFTLASQTVPDWDRRIDVNQAKSVAVRLATGKPSSFIPTRDGGFVLYLKGRIPVPEEELKQALPKSLASLRRDGQYEAFSEWFRHQLELSRISTITGKEESE